MIDRWWISKPTKNTTVTQGENCKDDRKVVSASSKAQNAQKIPTTLLAIHRHMRLLKWTSRVSLGQLCCCLHIDEQKTVNTNQQCVKQQSQNWRCSSLILFPYHLSRNGRYRSWRKRTAQYLVIFWGLNFCVQELVSENSKSLFKIHEITGRKFQRIKKRRAREETRAQEETSHTNFVTAWRRNAR